MSLPSSSSSSSNPSGVQSSIRSFFQPKQPAYSAPPSAPPPPPPRQQAPAAPPPKPVSPPPPPAAAPAPPRPAANGDTSSASASTPSRPPDLHPQATISRVRPEHVPALRRITSLLLPVSYPDSFYARLSDPLSSGAFSRVVLWSEPDTPAAAPKVIGGLVCRPEPSPFHPTTTSTSGTSVTKTTATTTITPTSQPNALYIQSLVLLSPYRSLGLAAALLDEVVRDATQSEFACETVYAHVWTENEEGLRWYVARGFARTDEVKGYYFKLRPDSAWVVQRDIGAAKQGTSAALGLGAQNGNANVNGTGTRSAVPGSSVTAAVANLPPPPLTLKTNTPPVLATTTTASSTLSPPPRPSGPSPTRSGSGTSSFQNARPETEWNDLPADMHAPRSSSTNLGVSGSGVSSADSSRSNSAVRKKRDRAYPAAAFGK